MLLIPKPRYTSRYTHSDIAITVHVSRLDPNGNGNLR